MNRRTITLAACVAACFAGAYAIKASFKEPETLDELKLRVEVAGLYTKSVPTKRTSNLVVSFEPILDARTLIKSLHVKPLVNQAIAFTEPPEFLNMVAGMENSRWIGRFFIIGDPVMLDRLDELLR
mgnify:CR=1 FL=1